jgi:hypothetical protein
MCVSTEGPVLCVCVCVCASALLQVLQAYQRYTYSAGAVGEVHARDAFLATLCEVAVTPVAAAEEAAAAAGKAAGRVSTDGAQVRLWLLTVLLLFQCCCCVAQ